MMDTVNALFEIVAAVLVWRNVLQLRRDGEIRGVYVPLFVFYSVWGLWNLVWYAHIGQPLSWLGSVATASGNVAWLYLAARSLRRKP